MKRDRRGLVAIITLLAIALMGAAACGKKSTPTDTFKAFYDAAKKKDAEAMKKTISKNLLSKLDEMAKQRSKPLDEILVNVNLPDAMPAVRNEKIEGDRATLEVQTRADSWKPLSFVKEDGEWKLDSE
ncbi:MAG: hypothetical protein DMF68_04845 [Acidobacteria bacterium]|nr:MAG: hypothetical protein DMF68_04845 [Acidobacteriota bacterium]